MLGFMTLAKFESFCAYFLTINNHVDFSSDVYPPWLCIIPTNSSVSVFSAVLLSYLQ